MIIEGKYVINFSNEKEFPFCGTKFVIYDFIFSETQVM
jgi:hypothetical protein